MARPLNVSKVPSVMPIALIPGLGHFVVHRKKRAFHLLGFFTAMMALVLFRWGVFWEALSSPLLDRWIASRFAIAALVLAIVFSVWDARRLAVALHEPVDETAGRSPFRVAMRRFSENNLALIALYVILFFYLVAILAPLLAPYDPAAMGDISATRYLVPSVSHPFGTDEFGRDWFSRAVYGARVSLSVGLLAVIVAVTFGTLFGSLSGYFGGFIDNMLMRIVDVIISIPTFFLLLMLVGVFEANLFALVLILGFTSWTGTARFIRGEILSLKERDFIESARAIGLPHRLIIFRHLIPNAAAPVLVSAALMVGGMIGAEAGLSFLGIGIRPPTPSWGNMVSAGGDAIYTYWWLALFPGVLLSVTILAFNLLADGLRDALDPKTLMRKYV